MFNTVTMVLVVEEQRFLGFFYHLHYVKKYRILCCSTMMKK